MKTRNLVGGLMLGVFAGGLALTPAFALEPPLANGGAQVEVGSEEGLPNMPEVTQGEDISTEEEFNPTITCTVGPGQTIADIIECLVDEIADPPPPCPPDVQGAGGGGSQGGVDLDEDHGEPGDCVAPYDRSDFHVAALPAPFWGVEILRLDGAPMERILFRENDPGIQTTQIRVDNADRQGRIGEVNEPPAGDGSVFVRVNDTEIEIPTSVYPTSVEITAAIVSGLRNEGFLVLYGPPYIHIVDMSGAIGGGIRRLQFRSTDHGITASDLALLKPSDPQGFQAIANSR